MNRIDKKFEELKRSKRKAFIAYITAGDPDLATTKRLALALEASGVDLLEIGIPFSDPIADGPTIQAASERALKAGANLKKIFGMAGELRGRTALPLVFMTYYNPVLRYGVRRFFESCKAKGVDGVIIPDLPHEEAKELAREGRRHAIATIFLVAPTSPRKRIEEIARMSTGFIYYVSLTGVTGAKKTLPPEVASKVRLIKSVTKKPVAIGFGVSDAKQAGAMAKAADGVIVGSAIVRIIGGRESVVDKVSRFAKGIAKAIHG